MRGGNAAAVSSADPVTTLAGGPEKASALAEAFPPDVLVFADIIFGPRVNEPGHFGAASWRKLLPAALGFQRAFRNKEVPRNFTRVLKCKMAVGDFNVGGLVPPYLVSSLMSCEGQPVEAVPDKPCPSPPGFMRKQGGLFPCQDSFGICGNGAPLFGKYGLRLYF